MDPQNREGWKTVAQSSSCSSSSFGRGSSVRLLCPTASGDKLAHSGTASGLSGENDDEALRWYKYHSERSTRIEADHAADIRGQPSGTVSAAMRAKDHRLIRAALRASGVLSGEIAEATDVQRATAVRWLRAQADVAPTATVTADSLAYRPRRLRCAHALEAGRLAGGLVVLGSTPGPRPNPPAPVRRLRPVADGWPRFGRRATKRANSMLGRLVA